MVARRAHNPEVEGSSPSPATTQKAVFKQICLETAFLRAGLHTDPASLSAPVPDFYFSRFYYLFFAKSGNKTLYSEKVKQVYDKIKETYFYEVKMEFGWINVFDAGILVLMMIPNMIYAIRNKGGKNLCPNQLMNILEQIGRYACILLMWFPLLVWKFGFASVLEMVLYLAGNAILLAAYWIAFAVYMKRKTLRLAVSLAILPACIFLLCGILLRHWLLVGFAVVFAVGHLYVTIKNAERTSAPNQVIER